VEPISASIATTYAADQRRMRTSEFDRALTPRIEPPSVPLEYGA
jgi:hypothetical protein